MPPRLEPTRNHLRMPDAAFNVGNLFTKSIHVPMSSLIRVIRVIRVFRGSLLSLTINTIHETHETIILNQSPPAIARHKTMTTKEYEPGHYIAPTTDDSISIGVFLLR